MADKSSLEHQLTHIRPPDKSLIIGITSIPAFFIIPLYLWVALTSPEVALKVLPAYLEYLLKFLLIFFLLALLFSRKFFSILRQVAQKPVLVSLGLFIAASFIVYNDYSPFSPGEVSLIKNIWPYLFICWLLFPIIQDQRMISKMPNSIYWLIKIPIWAIVFMSILMIVMVEGVNLFTAFLPQLFP